MDPGSALLFDTATDIGESADRKQANPEIASTLNTAALKWLDDLDAPRMIPNPEYLPAARR